MSNEMESDFEVSDLQQDQDNLNSLGKAGVASDKLGLGEIKGSSTIKFNSYPDTSRHMKREKQEK